MPNRDWKMAYQSAVSAFLMMAIIIVPSLPALAETTKRVELKMVMYVAGLTAGTMKLAVDFNDEDATTSLRLKSKGMVKMMTGYKGRSEATSALPEETWPIPISYDSAYETNKYDRKIEIRYNSDDGQITDLKEWKRGDPRTTNVPEPLRLETIDPLTAILHIRHWILALRQDPTAEMQQAFEVFDGRRRYRLNASIIERDEVEFGGRDLPAYRIKIVMEPLAGFSSKDMLANWSSEQGDRWIELRITDSDNPVPLSLETQGGTLKTSLYLKEVCDADDNCTDFDD